MTPNNKTKFKETEIGEIPEEWEFVDLKDVTTLISRGIPPKYTDARKFIVINQRCVRNRNLNFLTARGHDISKKNVSDEKTLKKGDTLLNSTGVGTIGRSGLFAGYALPVTADSHVSILRPNLERIDPEYMYWNVRNHEKIWEKISRGSTGQKELPRTTIGTTQIPLPPLPEQKRIASILSSLDDKIELNRRMNETLEEIGRTLFRRWFVEFNFPDENGKPYKESGGKMVDSELEEIPEGWRVGKLGELLSLEYGKGLPEKKRTEGNFPVVGSSGVVGTHNEYYVKGPGIVIGRKGTIGETVWIDKDFFPIDTTFFVKPVNENLELYFFYYLLQLQDFKQISAESAVPGLNRNQAYLNELAIPENSIIETFNELVEPIFKRMKLLMKETNELSQLRDSLLPRLMSGKVRV